MNTTHTRNKSVTAAVGAAIAAVAAPALLFLGAGTAHAVQDSETVAIQDSEKKPDITIGGFNPQPDSPGRDVSVQDSEQEACTEAEGGTRKDPDLEGCDA